MRQQEAQQRSEFDSTGISIRQMIQALERGEFQLYYQPQVNAETAEVLGAEALIRWRHPLHGLISASQFLPALQDVRFASRVGEWALLRARQDIERWRRAGFAPVPVSVNIHPEHLAMPGFAAKFLAISDGMIDVEIIETALRHERDVLPTVSALRAAGVRIALDDFGIGYSSFLRLAELPIDVLKVDKSFISALTHPRSQAHLLRLRRVLSAVVSLAHLCRMTTLAEGVETKADLAAIRSLGFKQFQGYLHSPAVSASAFRKFLQPPISDESSDKIPKVTARDRPPCDKIEAGARCAPPSRG
ncbi:MAG: EAL domain-containing protein [Steroidobacteraceae bacterium]